MCHPSVIEFFIEECKISEFKKKRILEIGSKYVNGSIRPLIERFFKPREYIGIDIEPGKFVDVVLSVEEIVDYFGEESFDVVISTEVLEHIKDWRKAINNIKMILKRGGYIYITTRSKGFPYHGYPYDFWRYEIEDFKKIFKDFRIQIIKKDHQAPGVFLKAKKPNYFKPTDITDIDLYSMILGRRTKRIPNLEEMPPSRRFFLNSYLLSKKYY